jgi:hypothetical protein
MRHATSLTKLLVIGSVAVLVSACEPKPRPVVGLNPPADLLSRQAEPVTPVEALTSEEAYERSRDAKIEWGRANAGIIDRACQWMKDAGVKLDCLPQGRVPAGT